MKRKWDGDYYAAYRDCVSALSMDPTYIKANLRMVRCLYELSWYSEAKEGLRSFKEKYPQHSTSQACKTLDRDIKDYDNIDQETMSVSDSDSEDDVRHSSDNERISQANDYKLRFCGHCNTTTDIKEANFFGRDGQFILAGSDDGRFFCWDRKMNIVRVLLGDESIVNCIQSHPSMCLLATSGLDTVVRLWSPLPEVHINKEQCLLSWLVVSFQDGTENDRIVMDLDDAARANQR